MTDPRSEGGVLEAKGDLETAAKLARLLVDETELFVISEVRSTEWNASSTSELSDELDEERIEELEAGAEPTEEEADLWREHVEAGADYWDLVKLYGVETEGGAAWLWLATDGEHQGSQYIDGSGPHETVDGAAATLFQYVSKWNGWWCPEGAETELAKELYERAVAEMGEESSDFG